MKVCYTGLLAAAVVLARPACAELVSAVQVVVNKDVITSGEIGDVLSPRLSTLSGVDQAEFDKAARKLNDQVVQSLVERDLIIHSFTSEGYQTNVLEAFIDDRIKEDIKKKYYGDRWRLIQTLQKEGITYEEYRRQQWEKFVVEYMSYQNSEQKKVIISPLKIQNYYNAHQDDFKLADQVKVKMIAINQPADAPEGTAHRVCDEILRKIESGVPFEEMAAVYSSGAQRLDRGDSGWIEHSYLTPELADVAFALKPGQHSGVIQLSNGACYILLLEDKRTAHVKPLSEVREEIDRTLREQLGARLRERWIQRMKEKSFVVYY
jgi:parvulin-like peptidyl-prolyl isomerase